MRRGHGSTDLLSSVLSRRELMRIGGIGFMGLNLAELFRAESAEAADSGGSTTKSPVDSCILLFQTGGPSHLDTWDMKPDAPREVRGEFKDIATRVPGLRICEHLPLLAKVADKLAIVRSLHHGMNDHNAAAVEVLCGHKPLEGNVISGITRTVIPAMGRCSAACCLENVLYPPMWRCRRWSAGAANCPAKGRDFWAPATVLSRSHKTPMTPIFVSRH